MDLISDISRWSKNYLSLDNLVYQILQLSESGERDFSSLTNNASVRIALLDFYNDIKRYKEALKEIKKLQKHVAHIRQNESNGAELDKIQNIDSIVVQKYSLLRPTALFNKKKYRVDIETQKLQSCSLKRRESKFDSDTSAESDVVFKLRTKAIASVKSAKSIMKAAAEKNILVAEPNIIEFYNCEPGLKYKKTIIVRNVYTQMARFRIEKRPDKTAFDIFVQSMTGGDKEDIAPGMYIKIIVQYTCDPLAEPRELLVLSVKNGITVPIEISAHRDPPILQVGTFISLGLSSSNTLSSSEIDSNTCSDSSKLKSSNESSSEEENKNEPSEIDKLKLSSSETREHSVESYLPCGGTAYASLDCKKCFVGELAIISTTLKNVGGNGRFFIMSELDWCSMRVVDMTWRKKLIVPPFAIWPAYFELQANEELTIYIYFFPDSYGLQVDELYIVSNNCSVKTIEVMGDGIMLEPQMFEFDKSIKYQWFQSENDALCTMRYLDLNYEIQSGLFIGAFVITYHCDLPLYYRWEKCNKLLCPVEYRNTILRKDLDQNRLNIEPDEGVFQPNLSILFKVTATIEDLPFEHYRALLRLIIEDIPCAAVPSRFNYSYTKSRVDRRLCENTVDVAFQEIEVRAEHTEDESYNERDRFKREETLLTASIMNITEYTNTTFTLNNQIALLEPSESNSSDSEDVCRLLKGYGTCDCCRTIITSTAVLRPASPLFVGVEEKFTVSLINKTNKRLKFWWGNIIGPDHTKLKINIEPKFDFIFPGEPHTVKIKCLPLETGVISSLFIPCQFDGIHPVNLSIECTIVSLSVAFYFPLECQENLFIPANLRIEWDSSEYISKYDKKTGEVRLFKQKIKEEKIIHDVILNSSESLNKTSSADGYASEEDALSCEAFSEIHYDGNGDNQNADVTTSSDLSKESWIEENESYDYDDYLPVVPYMDFRYNLIRKHFRYLPLIIEIHVNFQKTTRMRVYLENLSPISSDFSITTRNLWDKNEIHSDNSEFSEIMSGMVMSIEPMSGKIMPYDITFFEIVANSNTWGIYTDKITVNIDLLPSFFFWIRIINDDLPISYPICRNSSIKIPKIRFQIFKRDCASGAKKLLLENTSNIPLYVNWHCFLLNEEEKPFNLIFDMLSPFISMDEYLATNTSLYNLIKKYFSCAFNPYKSKDQLIEIDEYMQFYELNDNLENEFSDGFANKTKTKSSTSGTGNTSKVQYSNDLPSSSNNLKVPSKLKDIEFQLSIVPYYGKPDLNVFSIKPVELFLPPKQKRYIYISVNSDKFESSQKKVQCRACGFIRIPPIFRYKDNAFYRKDGHYLPPTQLLLECTIRRPKFILQSSRLERTFQFHITDFFLREKTELKAKKKIAFMNFDEDALDVQFVISKPFRIDYVSTLRERCIGANATVHPNENLEIELKCTLDQSWIDKAEDYRRRASRILTFVVLKKRLLARFRQGCSEAIEVFIKIIFPSLKISESNINFGEVEVGQVTTAAFNIYNLADRSQTFEIRGNTKYCKNQIFTFYPSKALLAAQSVPTMSVSEVTVNFVPKYPGNFEEIVEIISEIDGLIYKFSLKGVAIKLT